MTGAVSVSRRIAAPAAEIFQVLVDPARHVELDGSGMLRGSAADGVVTGVGDVFVMRMYYEEHGDYEMNNHVVSFEQDRRIGWEPAPGRGHPAQSSPEARWGHSWTFTLIPDGPNATIVTELYDCSTAPEADRRSMKNGEVWIPAMTKTLEHLEEACTAHRTGE